MKKFSYYLILFISRMIIVLIRSFCRQKSYFSSLQSFVSKSSSNDHFLVCKRHRDLNTCAFWKPHDIFYLLTFLDNLLFRTFLCLHLDSSCTNLWALSKLQLWFWLSIRIILCWSWGSEYFCRDDTLWLVGKSWILAIRIYCLCWRWG